MEARKLVLLLLLFVPLSFVKAQGAYTAASCKRQDVNSVINGPRHKAIDGDTIIIPAGSCSWTDSGVTVSNNIGITIIGNGTPSSDPSVVGASSSCSNTTITWTTSGNHLISVSPHYGNSTTRISCMKIVTTGSSCGGGGCLYPIMVNGTCTSNGCPNVRIDNLTTASGSMCNVSGASFTAISNMFGVADHNTIGDSTNISCIGVVLANVGHGSWQGVGSWGDNSWASADTFGTSQAFYLENNLLTHAMLTDTDIGGSIGGGARIVCRFNTVNQISSGGGCTGHGTDTTGRARGVRQWEAYYNTGTCQPYGTSTTCDSFLPGRSGVGRSFANTFINSGGFFRGIANFDAQRRWRPDQPWGPCDGSAPWDTNQGTIFYNNGTIGSLSGGGSASWTVIDSGSPGWTTDQWVQLSGAPYSIHDVTLNGGFEIITNAYNSVTADKPVGSAGGAYIPAVGHSYQILKALVCMDQSTRGAGALVKDSSDTNGSPVLVSTGNPGPVNQVLDPTYEGDDSMPVDLNNHTLGSDTGSIIPGRDYFAETVGQPAQTSSTSPFKGADYIQGVQGWSCNYGSNSCTITVASTAGFSAGDYVIITGTRGGNTYSGPRNNANCYCQITSLTSTKITYTTPPHPYTDTGNTGGFIASTGVGHGRLSQRPVACSTGVGYWATDQGSWNSFNRSQEGVLYVCTATNTWTLSYTPYTYPHPLIGGTQPEPLSATPLTGLPQIRKQGQKAVGAGEGQGTP